MDEEQSKEEVFICLLDEGDPLDDSKSTAVHKEYLQLLLE